VDAETFLPKGKKVSGKLVAPPVTKTEGAFVEAQSVPQVRHASNQKKSAPGADRRNQGSMLPGTEVSDEFESCGRDRPLSPTVIS
jgi:hypothetical protein